MSAPEPPPSRLWLSLIGVGLLLVAAGFLWQFTGDASQWLEREDAERYIASAVSLHGETMVGGNHDHAGHDHGPEEPAAIAEARRELADSIAKIESAKFKQQWLPRGLQALGAVLAAVGVIGKKSGQPS